MNPSTLTLFKSTNGAMSVCEGLALSYICKTVPEGTCVECGSAHGKSAIAAASTLPGERPFILIDPVFCTNSELDNEWVARRVWNASEGRINGILRKGMSAVELPAVHEHFGNFAYVMLDSGDHSYGLCRSECDLVEHRMVKGGVIALHDFRSQFTGVEKCYNELLDTGKFEAIEIPWEDILKIVNDGKHETGNTTWHHTELANPMFLGALRKK